MHLEGLDLKILHLNQDYTPCHPNPRAIGRAGETIDSLTLDRLETYDVSDDLKRVLDR